MKVLVGVKRVVDYAVKIRVDKSGIKNNKIKLIPLAKSFLLHVYS